MKIQFLENSKMRLSLLVITLLAVEVHLHAQPSADSIIMAALHDELTRNIQQLDADELDEPFFIAYSLADAKMSYANATLGAINNSGERKYKDWNIRVMVGDYQLNDENFSASQPQEFVYENSVDMPLDADYYGIRRSLWLTTNRVYNSAARTYKNKVSLIDHKELDTSDIDIPDFSKSPVVKLKKTNPELTYSVKELEDLARKLSGVFDSKATIHSSSVSIAVFESTVFFLNSEGTQVQYPLNVATVKINANTMTEDSYRISRSITYAANSPGELPDTSVMKADIQSLIAHVNALRSAPRFEEEYTGPVLFLSDEAPKIFGRVLFGGSDNLIASREALHSSNQMNMYYSKSSNSFESRLGKLVVSPDLSVYAEPALTSFNGIPLMGHYEVDAEGVMPPDSITLVKDGILQTLLNGRTPSRSIRKSNGHMRFGYSYNGLNTKVGPGVIRITSREGKTLEEMKAQLLETAKEYGLDYAYLVKPIEVHSSDKPRAIYRVATETGEEELIYAVRVSSPDLRSLKRPLSISSGVTVINTLWSGYGGDGSNGLPVSFIAPNGLLLDDIELSSYQKPLTSMLPVVENPVGNTDMTKSGEENSGNDFSVDIQETNER